MRYLLLLVIGLSLFLSGCYDEDKAEPSGDYSPVRFEFPQGNESWDKLFEQIYDNFGICVIYIKIGLFLLAEIGQDIRFRVSICRNTRIC